MNTAFQPEVLKWARERYGLSTSDLARKVGVKEEKVVAWEQSGDITLSQAERVAEATYVPFGYLFLPTPPVENLPVQDFRTVGSTRVKRASPNLLDTINDALRRQDWYRDYLIANSEEPLPFVGSLKVSQDIVGAASEIRIVIKWDAGLRSRISATEDALNQQIDAVEEAGILVMQSGIVGQNTTRKLDVGEFRGFALSDEYAPLIFLNGRDSKAARMFTLAHEIVHIWLGVSGISNLSQTLPASNSAQTEKFCNEVAAELLVPQTELETQWTQVQSQPDAVKRLSRHFKVSTLVILRRLKDKGHLSSEDFNRMYSDELTVINQKSKSGGGGDFYNLLRARLGKRFASALVESTQEGATQFRDAFSLMGVRSTKTFDAFAQMVNGATP